MKEQRIWASLHPFYEAGATLGRVEANRGFLRALLKADPFDGYHFFLSHPSSVDYLNEQLSADFPAIKAQGRFCVRLHREAPAAFAATNYYCLHLSDPFSHYSEAMSLRNAVSSRIFPLTAPTHSLSYAEYGAGFLKHIWPGTTPRDAVVASSTAGLKVVQNYYAALSSSYGSGNSPELRCIPLGVESGDFPMPKEKAALGQEARQRFELGQELIFLIFARISYQSKMDLVPILRACKLAEALGLAPGSFRLVLAGWLDEGDSFAGDIQRLAARLGIKCSVVPRPDAMAKKSLYAAADVFLSPSDNLQETFGLTMLEAAASGLPIIASDFDGYKDLVDDGKSGFLIPTYGPGATPESDALSSLIPASEYHLLLAQQCAVDVDALGRAMARLGTTPALRDSMGQAGRERALPGYGWDKIISRYLELWAELNSRPCDLDGTPGRRPRQMVQHPMHPPYMDLFGGYFSARLPELEAGGCELVWTKSGEAVYRGRDFPVIYALIEERLPLERLKKILFMARKPVGLAALRREFTEDGQGLPRDCDFLILWAMKQGFLSLVK